ncbi:hypothetical protein EG329_012709 [Mollisiaceae sp. DMI_Dod_QoI]|nr:hypothetical protein EG329_012709 [Helotiales sp. DMI_Dod_QoI]
MSWEININHHEKGKIYCPGETVCSTVRFKGPFNDTALSVFVVLRGTYGTRVDDIPGESYRDAGFLFNSPSQVFEGPCILLPGLEMVFNFSLEFPYTTQQCTGYSAQDPWLQSDHPLPPSVWVKGLTHNAEISYRLVAINRNAGGNIERRLKVWQEEKLLLRSAPLTAAPNYTLQSIDQPLRRPNI